MEDDEIFDELFGGIFSKEEKPPWFNDFHILSSADLDLVIGEDRGIPVGMSRNSPESLRKRVRAAVVSQLLGLKSLDYTLKNYVEDADFDDGEESLGNQISDYIARSSEGLRDELRKLHLDDPTFGVFGAEITLFRVPHSLDVARMLSNRGLLLEVLPILRLCLEMSAWAAVAFRISEEKHVRKLKAPYCVSEVKKIHGAAGRLYGLFSGFSHWEHSIHGQFLTTKKKRMGVIDAAAEYRAVSLALCLCVLEVITEVIRSLYEDRAATLIERVQGTLRRDESRKTRTFLERTVRATELASVKRVEQLMLGT